MDINRDNYEEYFLLYADDELTDSEKAEVLMFLKENKDLEKEFRMIHYTICKPETTIELRDKSFLLKGNEASFINEKNYEEIFVLYHDNELTGKQRLETEDFVARHAELRSEFELIGMAKLVPDEAIIFSNKKKLYKKEKTGKVVPLFWKALAAAVFIGSGLWITELYVQKENKKPSVAIQSIHAKQSAPVIEKKAPADKKAINSIVRSNGDKSQQSLTEIPHEKGKGQKLLQQKNNRVLVKTSLDVQKTGREKLTNQRLEEINNEDKINNEVAVVETETRNIPKEQTAGNNKMDPITELAQNAIQVNQMAEPLPHAQNASYISDVADNSQNYVFYDISTEEFKKTKVSSFLKKVKRVIERNNPISRLLSGNEKQVVSN